MGNKSFKTQAEVIAQLDEKCQYLKSDYLNLDYLVTFPELIPIVEKLYLQNLAYISWSEVTIFTKNNFR